MSLIFLFLWWPPWLESGAEAVRLEIRPLDFQREDQPQTFITGIAQIESDGETIFIAPHMEPSLLLLSREGRFLSRLGGKGQGPEELGSFGIRSLSVQPDRVWVLDGQKRAHYFEKGEHQLSWSVKSHWMATYAAGAFTLTFDAEHVIIPIHPATGHLAAVYNYGGQRVRYLGEILPIDAELIAKNRAINDTHWARDERYWYCLFKFWPKLLVFDRQFRKVAETDLTGPEIDICNGIFFGDIETSYTGPPRVYFRDFKVHGESLYFFCRDALYQVDKRNLKTLRRYKLFARLEEDPTWNGRPQHGEFFTLLDAKEKGRGPTLVMGWAHLPWEHDLWTAELPP